MMYPKKITMRTMGLVGDELDEIVKNNAKATPVLRVIGTMKGMETGKTDLGPFTKWKGEFGAKNLVDGEEARSMNLILPPMADAFAQSVYSSVVDGGAVQFACDITVERNLSPKGGGSKYVYGIKPLLEPSTKDALTIMMEKLGPPPMLNGPKKK